MAEHSSGLKKSLLAQKGEARPAEPGATDRGEDAIESVEGGFVFLRTKEPTVNVGASPAAGRDDPEARAAPQHENFTSEAPSAPAPDSDEAGEKAAAGSLLDYRLIRARDRQVCPGAISKPEARESGPQLHGGNLGAAMDVPRRAVPRSLAASSTPLPPPLPLARQGEAKDARAARGHHPATEPRQQLVPPVSDRPRHVRPAQAHGEAPLDRGAARTSRLPQIDTEALAQVSRKLGHFMWTGLRHLTAVLTGTPHLAYLAGLLLLCALIGVWLILSEKMPSSSETPSVSETPAVAEVPSEAAPRAASPVPDAAEEGLSVGTFKTAPMLSGEQADAFTPPRAGALTGPAPRPTEVVPPAVPTFTLAEPAAPGTAYDSPAEDLDRAGAPAPAVSEAPRDAAPEAAPEAAPAAPEAAPEEPLAPAAAPPAAPQPTASQSAAPAGDPATGAYMVQFFAARNRGSAERELTRLQNDLSNTLGQRQLHISESKDSGGRAMYRVRSDGFAEANAAQDFCGRLKAAGQDCLVVRRR